MSCVGTTRLSPKPPPSPWGSPSRTQSCTFGGPQWQALLATTACMACLVWAPTLRRPHHRPIWSPPRCCTPHSNIPTGRRSRGRSCRRLLNMELASSMVRFRRYQRTKAVPSPSAVAAHLHVASLLLLLLLIVVSSPLTATTTPATTNTPPITTNLTSADTTPDTPNLATTTPLRTTTLASPTLRSTLTSTPLGTTTTTTTTPLPSNKLGLFSPEVGDGANDGSMARQPEGEGGEKDKGLHCVLGVEDVFGCRGCVSARWLLPLPRSPHREGSRALYTLTPQPSDRDRGWPREAFKVTGRMRGMTTPSLEAMGTARVPRRVVWGLGPRGECMVHGYPGVICGDRGCRGGGRSGDGRLGGFQCRGSSRSASRDGSAVGGDRGWRSLLCGHLGECSCQRGLHVSAVCLCPASPRSRVRLLEQVSSRPPIYPDNSSMPAVLACLSSAKQNLSGPDGTSSRGGDANPG